MTALTLLQASCDRSGAEWSVLVRDVEVGSALLDFHSGKVLRTASVGKLFVLAELAARIAGGQIDPAMRLSRIGTAPVADSGLWWQLAQADFAIEDLALLIGAVSDNLATNVLIEQLGLGAVQDRARLCGYSATQLHDIVRDVRAPEHAETLSTGSAADLCDFMVRLAAGDWPGSDYIRRWLSATVDHSLVAAAFALDPLLNGQVDARHGLLNKTGSDAGVRADTGLIRDGGRTFAYAAVANWRGTSIRDVEILNVMRAVGEVVSWCSAE